MYLGVWSRCCFQTEWNAIHPKDRLELMSDPLEPLSQFGRKVLQSQCSPIGASSFDLYEVNCKFNKQETKLRILSEPDELMDWRIATTDDSIRSSLARQQRSTALW